ncbi:AraC family transcriptional regulator [Photobacterium lipolyticum]|uniref:AraC family transcriptional regulator n=1 Tax=Photobacterium lipolyticum TaxID=266810 RepID=A0A2T3N2R6_9GAMM|nr:GyrI-like domain-containing protein [Photobacterium lipolyticum]PSW06628.1 AraC family transcriptional regulator [Photobacterium lipolyticum]
MKTDYQLRLVPVIRYLEKNYNQPLNLFEVAELAHLSPFHFHRIFKAVTNETLADFIRRLKLQNAAQTLFYKNHSITRVALDYGFSSSQSLAKAFRGYYGLAPSEFKNCQTVNEFSLLLQKSKIGHVLSKQGHEATSFIGYSLPCHQQWSETMKTEVFKKRLLAYTRVTGPYGENYEPASAKLYQWAGAKGLSDGECLFIYHDNPDITPAEKCRTDICITVPDDTEVSGEIELQELPEGGYASIRGTVTEKSQYGQYWQELLGQVVESGLECDKRPCFELYHSYDCETGVADVSFYTAIKA